MIIAGLFIAFTALFALGHAAAVDQSKESDIFAQAGPDRQTFRLGYDVVPGSNKVSEGVWFSPYQITNVTRSVAHKLAALDDHCEESEGIHPETNPNSPLSNDCQVIYDRIVGPGTWTVSMWIHHQLVEYNSCAYGVNAFTSKSGRAIFAYIGNEDIRDVLRRSMDKHSIDYDGCERVGTWGQFICRPFDAEVEWDIYHQKGWTGDEVCR
ncbi:putative necrosis-inducing factor-domain-containing protein [Triangularia verruculosa]|uniref:Necrosis-inducing factor-domain-containing protein n=1 Tax=Triangularia verruculosa TaxID=2587418 RepID=A0AAN6XC15_9PEZI|nr:putative necrosis-inducing factor-domain-containing protein [Triangularia verruculosa]